MLGNFMTIPLVPQPYPSGLGTSSIILPRMRRSNGGHAAWRVHARPLCPPYALPHHARNEPRLAAGRLDVLFEEAVRLAADIARACIGPGPALVIGGTG